MPNYVVCLAHFCEIHGPSMILCTQKLLADSPTSSATQSSCESCSLKLPNSASSVRTAIEIKESFTESKVPKEVPTEVSKEVPDAAEREYQYFSTRYPQTQKLYTSLMKLVMKSLSVETVADPSKPLFHGDAANGYCLSKVFSISDLHARGAERKYAFLVLGDDETQFLSKWSLVSSYISEMALFLQKKVEHKREDSKSESVNEKYLRRSKIMPRSLVELTGDHDIFVRLHLCGVELLKDIT